MEQFNVRDEDEKVDSVDPSELHGNYWWPVCTNGISVQSDHQSKRCNQSIEIDHQEKLRTCYRHFQPVG